ncbi:hypothetical protein GCM10009861_01150 [Neomicrococcus aestuarii]
MFLDGGERHVVVHREFGHCGFIREHAPHNIPTRRIGERPKDPIDLVVAEIKRVFDCRNWMYNHLVVCYACRCSGVNGLFGITASQLSV